MQGRKTRTQKYCPCLSHTLINSTEFERKSKYLLNQQLSSIHNYFIMLLIINYHLRKWNWAWNDFQPLCPQKKLLLSYYSPLCTKEFLLIRWLPRLIASSTFSLIILNVRGTARKSISHRGERKSDHQYGGRRNVFHIVGKRRRHSRWWKLALWFTPCACTLLRER